MCSRCVPVGGFRSAYSLSSLSKILVAALAQQRGGTIQFLCRYSEPMRESCEGEGERGQCEMWPLAQLEARR